MRWVKLDTEINKIPYKERTLLLFGKNIFGISIQKNRQYFIRFFNNKSCVGSGFCIRNNIFFPPLFSERNGYTKRLKIGKWIIMYLPKQKITCT